MLAPSWGWILFANLLLGISQGLTWSTTVIAEPNKDFAVYSKTKLTRSTPIAED